MPQRHITYAVGSTTSDPSLNIPSGTVVRRRFSDCVALERRLRVRWLCLMRLLRRRLRMVQNLYEYAHIQQRARFSLGMV